jgi:prepilin-type processing-associated H-X9-DG protein
LPTRENQVVAPSDMIALGDATFVTGDAALGGFVALEAALDTPSWYNQVMRGLPAGDPAVQAIPRRHSGRWNIGFCDAHVENLRANNLFNVANANVVRRWNIDHQPHNEGWNPPPPP